MSEYTCFRKPVTIKRKQGDAYDVNGFWVPGTTIDINIKASIQPMKPEEMQQLPEGRRTDETFKIYTATKVLPVTDQNPDYLVIDGFDYEAISVAKYQSDVISHYKVLIQKKSKTQ